MAEAKTDSNAGADKARAMTAAEAAKHVGVAAKEVLAFKDCGSHVIVVTRAGKKLNSAAIAAAAKKAA